MRLNTNESPYPPPRGWVEALVAELETVPFNRYPDRDSLALRKALAGLHGVSHEQIYAANGSNEVLQALCLAYGGADRRVATFEPTYALHSHIARITGTSVVEGARGPDFELSTAEVARVVAEATPSITFLCSPNNPTGGAEERTLVEEVLRLPAGLVVVDEAYGQFSAWTAVDLVADDRPLVVVRTYSKTWAMAGMRLGYAVAPAAVVADLERVTLPYHLDVVKQIAGRLAVRFRPEMDSRVALLVAERDRVAAGLAALPVEAWRSDANFILFRPKDGDGNRVWQALADRSVLVRDCSAWPRLNGCLRVTIGTPEENDAFLAALAEVLA